MKKYNLDNLNTKQRQQLRMRPSQPRKEILLTVNKICADVKNSGDNAVCFYTKKFDNPNQKTFNVDQKEISLACRRVPKNVKVALKIAYANIKKFHTAEQNKIKRIITMPGVVCWRESRPIERVGLYIPAGTAPLPSTVLMLGIPASLAGCSEVVLCTPPGKDGYISDPILYAAKLCGINKIFKVGGAQAIAAMAYGTKTIPKVDKIFGPGNQFVTVAKQIVSIEPDGAAIDLPAGPSEVLVIADNSARPDFIAADLLSQAEHGIDSQVILVCLGANIAKKVVQQLKEQIKMLPRKAIAQAALKKSFIIIAQTIEKAIEFSNGYAPEHLILNVLQSKKYTNKIQNAGSVFLGAFTPESAGDYASGTNHTLPTAGAARAYSGVSLESFMKYTTFQQITSTGARRLGPIVSTIAEVEGLTAHKRAMNIRYQ